MSKKKFNCESCGKGFSTEGGLNMHTKVKHPSKKEEGSPALTEKQRKKINWVIFIIAAVGIVGFIWFSSSNAEVLPPIDMQGHIEVNPPSHIMKEPMLLTVQKHMLEHADGSGPPGVIINYNCDDYECEPDLIEKLEGFAVEYSENVYVAPFENMDAKIALTRLRRNTGFGRI